MNLFEGYAKKIIIPFILSTFLLYLFPIAFKFEIFKVLNIIIITFVSDNTNVKWRNKNRLVSNVPGFIVAYLYGPQYILLSSLITFFRIDKNINYIKKTRKFLVYFSMYYGAYIITKYFNVNLYMKLFLFITFSKILNSILSDIWDFDIKIFSIEYIFFLASLPSIYLYLISQNNIIRLYFLYQNLFLLGIYYSLTKYMYEKEEEKIKNIRLKRFNEIMVEFSNLLQSYSLKASKELILKNVADFLNKKLGYKYVLISEIDYENDRLKRVAYAGISDKDFEKLKNNDIKPSETLHKVLNEKYRYENIYFIPKGSEKLDNKEYFVFEQNINANNIYNKDYLWHPEDLLIILLTNKNDEIIGYISCDSPENGLRPTQEEMQILSVLSKIVSMILVHGEYYQEAVYLSETDHLTGLYNSSKLNNDLKKYKIKKSLISLALIDLDDFKKINDTYGHLKGDKVLKEFSDIIKSSIRSNDKAYRYGGDEFVIIFENIKKYDAKKIIERIKDNIEKLNIKFSVGIEDSQNVKIDELIKNADEKAYIAKRKGKNKIVV